MNDLQTAELHITDQNRPHQMLINRFETGALTILIVWCLLPVLVSCYDIIMGLTRRFPQFSDEIVHAGYYYYPEAIRFYYVSFCVLGVITLLFAVTGVAVSFRRIFNRNQLRTHPWLLFLLLLLVWAAVCTLVSDYPMYCFTGDTTLHNGFSSYPIYASIFICASMVRTERTRKIILRVFCIVVCYLSLLMILQEIIHGMLDVIFPSFRAVVFNNSNHFGYILCMAAIGFVGLFLYDNNTKAGLRGCYLAGFTFVVYTLLINDTLGASLATICAMPVVYCFFVFSGRKLSWSAFLPVVMFLILLLCSFADLLPLASTLGTDMDVLGTDVRNIAMGSKESDHAGSGRFILWKDTVHRIADSPIFGAGPEGLVSDKALTDGFTPHNEYLQITACLGFPGLILYLAALVSLAVHQFRQIKILSSMVLAVSGVTVVYLISAFVGNPVFNTYPYFWMFLGLTTGVNEFEYPVISPVEVEMSSLLRKPPKKHLLVLLAVVMVAVSLLLFAYYQFDKKAEIDRELADLQGMRAAMVSAQVTIKNSSIEDKEQYWVKIDGFSIDLIPVSEKKPTVCGLGTKTTGGGMAEFIEETGLHLAYDESIDYRDKIMMVTLDPDASEEEQVQIEWVRAE